MRVIITITLAATIGLGLGCPYDRPNPNHCVHQGGDALCRGLFEGRRPYCVRDFCRGGAEAERGCVAERPSPACWSPCGERSLDEDPECEVAEGSSTTGASTSEIDASDSGSSGSSSGGGTTGSAPCGSDDDCPDPAAPFCGRAGSCVACDEREEPDLACEAKDPLAPVCADGACVQCAEGATDACDGITPVCDDATHACVGCTDHQQCGEAACDRFSGACLPAQAVVHVGPGQPLLSLAEAVDGFGPGERGTIIVHGNGSFDEAVTIDGGRVLALLAHPGDRPRWILSGGGSPQLTVVDAVALLDRLQLSGNGSSTDRALEIVGGSAWVDRGRIIDNNGGGVVVSDGGELVLRNCFVGSLGDVTGVEVEGASARVLYSTVTASTFAATPALACSSPIAVEVRNSIVVSQGGTPPDEIACDATVIDGATEAEGAFDLGWFADFNAGDYRLTPAGATAFADRAVWEEGDPPTDIEGDARPTVDGSPDHAGADRP